MRTHHPFFHIVFDGQHVLECVQEVGVWQRREKVFDRHSGEDSAGRGSVRIYVLVGLIWYVSMTS